MFNDNILLLTVQICFIKNIFYISRQNLPFRAGNIVFYYRIVIILIKHVRVFSVACEYRIALYDCCFDMRREVYHTKI